MSARSKRGIAVVLGAAGLAIGVIAMQLGAVAPAAAEGARSTGSSPDVGYQVTQIFSPTGLATDQGYPLSKPDDIVQFGRELFVAFQNGVGSTGGTAANGNAESSLLELSRDGHLIRQWELTGKIDGLGVDPAIRAVVATVNEDGNSSLYSIDPDARDSGVTHYCYDQSPLPHTGGTDSVAFYQGKLILSASAPPVPAADVPAVYSATLKPDLHPTNCPAGTAPATGTAMLTNGFSNTSPATPANSGAPSTLGLTDPDSSTVVPYSAPRFGGSFMLDSQGDDQQIFTTDPLGGSNLNVLQLSQSVDDTAFVTSKHGALYVTDPTANTVDKVTGRFEVGQAFVAVTPCNDNNAPATCPAPPTWPANSLGQLNLTTGAITTVSTGLNPVGMIFVPNNQGQDNQGQNNQH